MAPVIVVVVVTVIVVTIVIIVMTVVIIRIIEEAGSMLQYIGGYFVANPLALFVVERIMDAAVDAA